MLENLKVLFMGTPEFSLNILENLIINTNLVGVVSQPDKIVGRKKELLPPPVKELAIEHNIKVFQPLKIKDDYQSILELEPDIIITCAYGQILPREILLYPKYGCINVHASLLPKLRGGAPIHHALIDGYKETGITIMYMDEAMDSGDIISQEKVVIEETDTYRSLHDKLSKLGSELLIKTLPSIIKGNNSRIKQNSAEVTYGYNIKREEEKIDFNQKIDTIYNQIRGLNDEPGSYFLLDNKTIKVYNCLKIKDNNYQELPNGYIVKTDKEGLYIKGQDGLIKVLEIKIEGKKKMLVRNFLNGNKENLVGKVVNEGEKDAK